MPERETVYLDGKFCQYREMVYGEEWKRIREANNEASKREIGQANYCGLICPLCNKELDVGQESKYKQYQKFLEENRAWI